MSLRHMGLIGFLVIGPAVYAQQPAPPGMTLQQAATRRFPQPVRVGFLLKREVLQPLESQPVLGSVRNIVQRTDGGIDAVVDYGGYFGFFARPIAVPIDAMVLVGQYMEIVDFTPDELKLFKTFDGAGTTPVPLDSLIRVGLGRPSH